VYGDWSGRFKEDFMRMKAAGKCFKVKEVYVFTFTEAGKITTRGCVQSLAGMMGGTEK
jgi:hypothetical protein